LCKVAVYSRAEAKLLMHKMEACLVAERTDEWQVSALVVRSPGITQQALPVQVRQDVITGIHREVEQPCKIERGIAFYADRLVVHRAAQAQYPANDVVFDVEIICFNFKTHTLFFVSRTGIGFKGNFVFQVGIADIIVAVKAVVNVIAVSFRYGGRPVSVAYSGGEVKLIEAEVVAGV